MKVPIKHGSGGWWDEGRAPGGDEGRAPRGDEGRAPSDIPELMS